MASAAGLHLLPGSHAALRTARAGIQPTGCWGWRKGISLLGGLGRHRTTAHRRRGAFRLPARCHDRRYGFLRTGGGRRGLQHCAALLLLHRPALKTWRVAAIPERPCQDRDHGHSGNDFPFCQLHSAASLSSHGVYRQ
jgi:hypothetical protein